MMGPLLTQDIHERLLAARRAGAATLECSLDLQRSQGTVEVHAEHWHWQGHDFPYLEVCKERTIYHWNGAGFAPVARFGGALIKLVPTEWGAPTFEIDGIKMLPTAQVSPYEDAARKVALVRPRGAQVLDTCGGLGYFAACCLAQGAAAVRSFEKNVDVLWLRDYNPWSPDPESPDAAGRLQLEQADVARAIAALPDGSFDAALHDPPRFGIAGELYSQAFYDQLARVLRPQGRLFHYTGSPNKLTSGRDVPGEVSKRLLKAGFRVERALDGVFAINAGQPKRR